MKCIPMTTNPQGQYLPVSMLECLLLPGKVLLLQLLGYENPELASRPHLNLYPFQLWWEKANAP